MIELTNVPGLAVIAVIPLEHVVSVEMAFVLQTARFTSHNRCDKQHLFV